VRALSNTTEVSLQSHHKLPHFQFEDLCSQLKALTPCELRRLQDEINHSLQSQPQELLTSEERELLSSLF
jgi:hypothetical protein